MNYRRLLVCFSLLVVTALAHAQQSWVEVTSPHFSVVTDAGDKRGHEVALRFEQMRTAFGVLFHKLNVNTGVPLEIVAFRNSKEMRQIAPLYEGKPITLSGIFLGGGTHGNTSSEQDRQFIALDLSAEDSWSTVFHEYAHLLINNNFPPTPVWFDEGFAEYCSSLKVDKKEIAVGLPRPDLPYTLSQNNWLRLVDLFSVGHNSKIYNRDDRRSVFYAQSWITVHYLMAKNLLKQLSAYNRLTMEQHVPVPDAIRQAFSMEPEQLQKSIENYFRSAGVTYFKAPAPPGSDEVQTSARQLSDLEAKTILADLDFHTRDYRERAITAFSQIIASQPDNPIANRALGYEALQRHDMIKATEYLQRAAANSSKDPQLHYFLAMLIGRKHMPRDDSSEDFQAMKKELDTAISLDANYADAHGLLGLLLSGSENKDAAIQELRKAIALSPRNEGFMLNLASVYMREQKFDEASALLAQLQSSSNPAIAAMAGQQLSSMEAYKNALSGRGDPRAQSQSFTMPRLETRSSPRSEQDDSDPEAPRTVTIQVNPEPIIFMKGVLVSVDCSSAPSAMLTITSAGKTWKMLAPDSKKLILSGADQLSCSWTNRKVAINYRKSGDNEGKLVSLELE